MSSKDGAIATFRPLLDMRENYFYDIPAIRTPRRYKGSKRQKRPT